MRKKYTLVLALLTLISSGVVTWLALTTQMRTGFLFFLFLCSVTIFILFTLSYFEMYERGNRKSVPKDTFRVFLEKAGLFSVFAVSLLLILSVIRNGFITQISNEESRICGLSIMDVIIQLWALLSIIILILVITGFGFFSFILIALLTLFIGGASISWWGLVLLVFLFVKFINSKEAFFIINKLKQGVDDQQIDYTLKQKWAFIEMHSIIALIAGFIVLMISGYSSYISLYETNLNDYSKMIGLLNNLRLEYLEYGVAFIHRVFFRDTGEGGHIGLISRLLSLAVLRAYIFVILFVPTLIALKRKTWGINKNVIETQNDLPDKTQTERYRHIFTDSKKRTEIMEKAKREKAIEKWIGETDINNLEIEIGSLGYINLIKRCKEHGIWQGKIVTTLSIDDVAEILIEC